MGGSARSRIMFNRRRLDIRKYLKLKYFFVVSLIAFVCSLAVLGISGAILANKIKNSTIVYASDEKVYEINDNNEYPLSFCEYKISLQNFTISIITLSPTLL